MITYAAAIWLVAVPAASRPACPSVRDEARVLSELSSQPWWRLGPKRVRDMWPGTITESGCGSVEGACLMLLAPGDWPLKSTPTCNAEFFFGAEAKGRPYTLDSLNIAARSALLSD